MDGGSSRAKLADGRSSRVKLADGRSSRAKLADGGSSRAKLLALNHLWHFRIIIGPPAAKLIKQGSVH